MLAAAIRHFRDEFEYHVRFPEKLKIETILLKNLFK
jgi:hypothetical protein